MFGKKEVSAFTLVVQIGLNMIVPILGLTVFGAWLGERVGQSWVAIPFFVLGVLSGGTSVYRLVRKYLKRPQDANGDGGESDAKDESEVDDAKENK